MPDKEIESQDHFEVLAKDLYRELLINRRLSLGLTDSDLDKPEVIRDESQFRVGFEELMKLTKAHKWLDVAGVSIIAASGPKTVSGVAEMLKTLMELRRLAKDPSLG